MRPVGGANTQVRPNMQVRPNTPVRPNGAKGRWYIMRSFAPQATSASPDRSDRPCPCHRPAAGRRRQVQPKRWLNTPGDRYEQEAERVAGQLVGPAVGRGRVAVSATPVASTDVNPMVERDLHRSAAGGAPLPQALAGEMGRALGFDFSRVRIHSDSRAAQLNTALGARAFTYGQTLYFGTGQYDPVSAGGRRLLAHELTHVVQQSGGATGVIQRQTLTPDWQAEADRLTTEELEAAVASMRAQLAAETESSEESEQLAQRLAVFEQTLIQRQGRIRRFEEGVAEAREQQRELLEATEGAPVLASAAYFMTQRSADALFILGFMTGYAAEIPPGELQDYEREMQEHWPEFSAGYVVGLPVGLWHGLTGLIEGLWMLAQLGAQLSPAGILSMLTEEGIDFASDPEGYIARRRQQYEQVRAIAEALQAFGAEFRRDPTVVMQWSSDFGLIVGQEFADYVTTDYLRQSPYDKGYLVGDIVGQILFEVLLEIILAVTTEGVGNVMRGVAAVGQGARASGRIGNALRRMLESSAALRNLLRAVTGAEDVGDVARLGERGRDVVRGAGDEALEGAGRALDESAAATPPTGAVEEPAVTPEDLRRPVDEEAAPTGVAGRQLPPALAGCRVGSLWCPMDFLRGQPEFQDHFAGREGALLEDYLGPLTERDLDLGPSPRSLDRARILTGDEMYQQYMEIVGRSAWSEPFQEAQLQVWRRTAQEGVDYRRLIIGGREERWPLQGGQPWTVHHEPPLEFIGFESSEWWRPMPLSIHDDVHAWWTGLRRLVLDRVPRGLRRDVVRGDIDLDIREFE